MRSKFSGAERIRRNSFSASTTFAGGKASGRLDAEERRLRSDLRGQEKQYAVTQSGMDHAPCSVVLRVGSIGLNVFDKKMRSVETLLYEHTRVQILNTTVRAY